MLLVTGVRARNNVQVYGPADGPVLLFAHGFGTDQGMWGKILPHFIDRYRVVLFDHVGSGQSDQSAYASDRYSDLQAYVNDLLEICADLELRDVTLIGHSVGAMMAVSAATQDVQGRLSRLVLLAASPSYLDHPDDGYVGGFSRQDLDELFESLDANYVVWANAMSPVFMNAPHAPDLDREIQGSFCRINPRIGRDFARVAFLSDVRHLLGQIRIPVQVLQSSDDVVTPFHVGTYLHQGIKDSVLTRLTATGHFPQSSAPEETAAAMLNYLQPAT
ncbi:Sigma factor SigB regulation protein RsbQ [Arthrobacter sp. SO5]|uniref:alpha/beta fold hydrolase n=1 Tax=Arthrobacter sp. SO5 TaxID=1897055 RepID=UPI001E2CB671|nr:alpha/beta hydrolase [Arthrobacter sp. SO5]MCB5273326.1 Sigma factor SigB regulation protein RsbQ [Arthrobacter sp. SO5]